MSAVAAVLLAWAIRAAAAQNSSVTCQGEPWSLNADGDDPCILWAQLASLCRPEGFVVPSLQGPSTAYSRPDGADDAACQCNVVAYRLMSACSVCQPGIIVQSLFNESHWRDGCVHYNDTSISIPVSQVEIPRWAFVPEEGQTFDPTQASIIASYAGATITPSASDVGADSQNLPTTAIAGGIAGGLAVIGILAAAAPAIFRRLRRVHRRPRRRAWNQIPDVAEVAVAPVAALRPDTFLSFDYRLAREDGLALDLAGLPAPSPATPAPVPLPPPIPLPSPPERAARRTLVVSGYAPSSLHSITDDESERESVASIDRLMKRLVSARRAGRRDVP